MSNKIKFLIFIIALIIILCAGIYFKIDSVTIQNYLKGFPLVYSGIIFVILYCVVTFFIWFGPKDVFKFVAAILFGAYVSTIFIFIAELINAVILFKLARYLGRDYVKGLLKGKYEKIDKKLADLNFLWLFLFRIVSLIPFRFLDLGCGLTGINFRRYLVVVILASPLRIFIQQYFLANFGKMVFNPWAMGQQLAQTKWGFIFSLIYLSLIIVVVIKLKNKK